MKNFTSKTKIAAVVFLMMLAFILTGCITEPSSPEENSELEKRVSELEGVVKDLSGGTSDETTGEDKKQTEDKTDEAKTAETKSSEDKAVEQAKEPEKTAEPPVGGGSNLKVVEDHLEGKTSATGFLVVQNQELFEEKYDIAYFAIVSGEKVLTDWISDMVKKENSVNRMEEYPMLGLGCDTGKEINGTWLKVSGGDYVKLKASSKENPVKISAVFVDPPDIGGACLSFAKEIKPD